jgi:CubicO group peptidase (beta-lactamase class C family)
VKLPPDTWSSRIDRHPLRWVLALAVCVSARGAQAQQAPPSSDTAAIRAARDYLREAQRGQLIPGVQVAVMRGGRLVWSEGFGLADLEQRVPVTRETRFRIGSVAKPLTATALALLAQQGRVELDAPVQRYVPAFPAHGAPITLRQLAGHLAGVRHYTDAEDMSTRRFASVDEAVTVFSGDSVLHPPGARFSYSSYGYVLLSAAIERVAGEPFTAAMRRMVFAPLGLTRTTFDHADSVLPGRARGYHRAYDGTSWVGPVTNAPFVDLSNRWAAGGMLSTAEDLARFGDALLQRRLLDERSLRALWTPQRTAADSATGYGLGFFVASDAQRRARVYHAGNATGATAKFLVYPDNRVVVAILWNGDFGDFAAGRVAEPFLSAPPGGR